jgi:hypothetical protein
VIVEPATGGDGAGSLLLPQAAAKYAIAVGTASRRSIRSS